MGKEAGYIQYSIDGPPLWTAIDPIILLQGAKSTQFPGQRSLNISGRVEHEPNNSPVRAAAADVILLPCLVMGADQG